MIITNIHDLSLDPLRSAPFHYAALVPLEEGTVLLVSFIATRHYNATNPDILSARHPQLASLALRLQPIPSEHCFSYVI